jgi:hypothetical protein
MPVFLTLDQLRNSLTQMRAILDPVFSPDTALGGIGGNVASIGHCAAVAAIVQHTLGGSLVSALVQGESHWFNRFQIGSKLVDADITGDQFGFPTVRLAPMGTLFDGTRERLPTELSNETVKRSAVLAQRAGLPMRRPPRK